MSDVGGSVTSRDGQLVVAVPAGAAATPVELTVTEITNTAPGGVGRAYRLGPEGTRFAAPVALIFRAAADAALSDFTVATQDPTGYWVRVPSVRRDEAGHTIVATTTHFSDWVLVLAPSDRDLSGVFRIASTRDGLVANGVSRFFFESGDASSNFYLQSGRITVETPISRPTATCQPDVATKNVGPNIGEIHSDPSRFIWGATGIWDLTCTPTAGGTTARDFASVVFENLGLNYPRCTRSYLTPPLVGTEDVQGSYEINCGSEGTITADWHFQKCVPGAVCQTANVCRTAAINCDFGLPLCVENGNVTNGTSCGTNAVCGDGVCNPCTVGEACTPTNNCHTGGITCDTGFKVCTDTGTSLPNGTVCGTNQVCFTGTCVACTAGSACATNPNECVAGTTSCATGQEVCVDTTTNIANGTACVIDATPTVPAVCNGGVCNACTAGLACATNPNPCKVGTTSCATGASTCVDTAANIANGTTCDVNPTVPEVCNNGLCSACTAGLACATNPNPCVQGTTSCATGQSLCVDTATPIANGTTCDVNPTVPEVCNNGLCSACTAGTACSTNPNPCVTGTTSCATGAETCVDTTTNIPNGTTCGTNRVCSNGVCSACTAGLGCATNPNPCVAGTTSCSTGVETCVNTTTNIPNGTSCGTNQVCNGGTCSACTAGAGCATNPDPCLTGITSCSTGTSVCLDNGAAPEPNGTTCGTNQVCNGGTCSACTAGVTCGYNSNPCVDGVTSCATGSETCENTATPKAAGTVCGVNLVCNGAGACNPCTAGVTCITNPAPCLTGITSCATGAEACIDNGAAPEPNGTSCGQDLVCNGGSCVGCIAAALCGTNPNPCVDGVTSCATGTQQCLDTATAKPDGTTCGTDAVCSAGVCSTCVAGATCTTNPDPCLGGITSCTTGTQQCVDDPLAPEANGTSCGTNQVCNGGVCGACTAGLTCAGNPNPCFAGTTSCTTGTSVCVDSGTVFADGTSCGTNQVCNAGVCSPCTAGLVCATNPDPCKTGITSCSTGTSVCVDNAAAPEPDGTTCGSNQVCNGGTCTTCVAGVACATDPDPCHTGLTSCASGSQTCVATTTAEPNGTVCGTNQVCNGGACVGCTAGGACATNPNPCVDGAFSCATGSQTCVNTATNKPAGTTCGTNLVCNGSGACVSCTAGADCTPPSSCTVHETSCATGAQTCVDTLLPVANGTVCGTNQVCSGGVCSACAAGQACSTNPNVCLAGTTSCSTGTQQCLDTAAQLPNGTSCGTNQVCNAGACVPCVAGGACTTNPNPCVDGVGACATGALTCDNTTTQKPNGTTCGTNQVCSAGTCVACTAGAACTTNPNICLAGVTSCATGAQVCEDGTTPANEGATCGTDLVCRAGACTRVITGNRLVTRWTTGAGCSAAAPCSTTTVAPDVLDLTAQVEAIGADGVTRYPGTFSPGGSFSIPNVPPGPYTLVFSTGGVTHFISTSSTTVDLGYDVLGRGGTLATLPTPVTVTASTLSPWIESDEVQLFAPDLDVWDAPISAAEVLAGEVSGSVAEDWSASSVGRALSLLASTDVVWMHQLATSTVTADLVAYAYQAATRSSSTAVVPSMTNGAAADISATLAPITQTGDIVIDWRTTQFEALLASMGPSAQAVTNPHALAVRTLPYAVSGPAPAATAAAELFRLVRPAAAADANLSALTPPIVYGRFLDTALWSEWRDASFTARVSYTAPGAASSVDVPVRISRREPMLPAPPSPIVPQVGTVQSPLVNGLNALGALGAVGPSPTLAWSAPLAGVPSSYRVTIRELRASGTASTTQVVATFTTTGLSVTVPAGTLVAGRTYFAEIASRVRAPEGFTTAPNRQTAAGSDASTLTSTFTP